MSLTFATPLFLGLLASLPLVIWWHVQRVRHRPRPVAALFLWEEARREAAQRRRWRPSWSLLLQLLAVAAAAFALAQPSLDWRGPPDWVLVVDARAGMRAIDPEGERLQRAREAALEIATGAGAVAVVRAGTSAEVVLGFTRDRDALRAALAALEAGDATGDPVEALALARSLAAGAPIAWLSDDPGPPATGVQRINVAGSGRNLGIVAFDLGVQQAFVAVVSSHPGPQAVQVAIERLDGTPLAISELFVPALGRTSVTLPWSLEGEMVRARLLLGEVEDALALDNVAYAGQRPLRVVMDRDEPSLRRALSAVPGVGVEVTGAASFVAADVRVLSDADLNRLPRGDLILLPPLAATTTITTAADWERTDPLLRFVDLRETRFALGPARVASDALRPWEAGAAELAAQGWRVLARSPEDRVLLAWRETETARVFAFGAHPAQSDIIFRTAFPTLVANLAATLRGSGRAPLGVVDDAGRRVLEPGVVQVGGREVGVSLLSEGATRLAGPAEDDADGAGWTDVRVERPTPLAPWLLLLAALALSVEWWPWASSAGARAPAPRPAPRPR
jgi:hypothetical protein